MLSIVLVVGDQTAGVLSDRYFHARISLTSIYSITFHSFILQAGVRFPGAEDIPAGFAALPAVPGMVWAQMIGTWTMMEMANRDFTGTGEFVGDFRNGALDFGWDKLDEVTKKKKRSVELNNGRAAQMGILGLMTHEMMGNIDALPIIGGH